jgi:hypothetical protein
MRFAQAQPPPALRIAARTAEELDHKRRELLDGAVVSLSWEERTEQRGAVHTGIKSLC